MDDAGKKMISRKPFGRRAVERGFATEGEVLQALRAQYNAKIVLGRHLFLGEVLLLQGVLTPRQLTELLKDTGEFHEEAEDVVDKRFFGDLAIELEFVKPQEVFDALNEQMDDDMLGRRHRLLGEILYSKGLLTDSQVDAIIARLHAKA